MSRRFFHLGFRFLSMICPPPGPPPSPPPLPGVCQTAGPASGSSESTQGSAPVGVGRPAFDRTLRAAPRPAGEGAPLRVLTSGGRVRLIGRWLSDGRQARGPASGRERHVRVSSG